MKIYAVWIKTGTNERRWADSFWLTSELAATRASVIREAQRAGGCFDNFVVTIYAHELMGASLGQPKEKEAPFE